MINKQVLHDRPEPQLSQQFIRRGPGLVASDMPRAENTQVEGAEDAR